MAAYSNVAFPLLVAMCYVLGQLSSRVRRTTWFGVLNAVAVGVLFGWRSLLILLVLTLVYWTALAAVTRVRPGPAGVIWVRFAEPILYISAAIIFIMHKSLLEPRNDFSSFPLISSLSHAASVPMIHGGVQALQLIALSYIFLRLIDLIRSVLDGATLLDPLAMSGFLVPFFMTPAGPVNVYSDHVKMDEQAVKPVTVANFVDSTFLIVCGYFLKFVVAQLFSLFLVGVNGNWPTTSIGGTAVFLLYVFLEFSGYSLIALGVGCLLSIPTPVNFNHPYLATTVGEFWNRWHMSLGQFVRRNLYIPTQVAMMRRFGRKNREIAYITNILALSLPFIFVGIWHRFTWSFLLWGISLGIIVAVEKVVRERLFIRFKRLHEQPRWITMPLGIVYTLTVVVVTLHIASGDFIR
jgi:D-alanyl-lipoteichoic acid acyltransferase DltB (MBOAT superfamily)